MKSHSTFSSSTRFEGNEIQKGERGTPGAGYDAAETKENSIAGHACTETKGESLYMCTSDFGFVLKPNIRIQAKPLVESAHLIGASQLMY
jgi:hypothetical protein